MKCNHCKAIWNAFNNKIEKCPFCGESLDLIIRIADNTKAHVVLRHIYTEYRDVFFDSQQLNGYLTDLFKGADREKRILRQLITADIVNKLWELNELDDIDKILRINNIKQYYKEEHFLTENISSYIVDCFVFAYNWIDYLDVYVEEDELNVNIPSFTDFKLQPVNNGSFLGELNDDNLRNGFGIFKGDNDILYSGEWKVNIKSGWGIMLDPSKREKYAGEWRLNKATGVGVKLMQNGEKRAGQCYNGKMKGFGISYLPNGECYIGKYTNDIIDGYGIKVINQDEYIIGKFIDGVISGKCTHIYADGRIEIENF